MRANSEACAKPRFIIRVAESICTVSHSSIVFAARVRPTASMPASALARVNSIAFSMQVSMPAMAASEVAERAVAFSLVPFPIFSRSAWAASSCAVLAAAAPRQARTVASALMRMVRSKASRPSAAMLSSVSGPAVPKADCVVPVFALASIFDSPRP